MSNKESERHPIWNLMEKYGLVTAVIVNILFIIGSVFGAAIWMNSNFRELDTRMYAMEKDINGHMSIMERDIAIIKTVMCMKGIMPNEMATIEE